MRNITSRLRPKTRINQLDPKMRAEAAEMAAESAPLVPTSNVKMQGASAPPASRPDMQPASSSMASGFNTGGGGMNVTGDNRGDEPRQFVGDPYGRGSKTPVSSSFQTVSPEVRPVTEEDVRNGKSKEQLHEELLRDLIGSGVRDTSEEEALLREQMLRDVGAGQAGLNARMGASGFGTSGALGAMGTDMRARAALEASKGVQGARDSAREEWLRKIGIGLGGVQDDRGMDLQEDLYERVLEALAAQNDVPVPPPPPPSGKERRQGMTREEKIKDIRENNSIPDWYPDWLILENWDPLNLGN